MIVVYTADMERLPCVGANRYRTDEHNNLEILTGKDGEQLAVLFNENHWNRVVIEDPDEDVEDDDDGEDQMEPFSVTADPLWGR